MTSDAFLIGGGQIHRLIGERGETPPCPDAKFNRGDVVNVRRNKAVGHFPAEMIVLVAIPPGFSPDDAMADLLGEPRPLMKQVGSRSITYLVYGEEGGVHGHLAERYLLPSGKEPLNIGTISRGAAWKRIGRSADGRKTLLQKLPEPAKPLADKPHVPRRPPC